MKKSISLAALFLFAIGAAGVYAEVTGNTTDYGTTMPSATVGGQTVALKGNLSTNVKLAYTSSADNSGYTAGTYHEKGTRTFASSSGDAALYYSITTDTDIPAAPTGTDTANFVNTTWTKI